MSDEVPYKDFDEDGIDPWLALSASQGAVLAQAAELERLRGIEEAARNLHPESRGDSKRYHLVTKSRYAALRQALSPNPSETGGRE